MAKRAIFFDIETTGIKIGKDRIVEIAAYDPENQKEYTSLINPEIPIPLEAQNIHKISDEMVQTAPTLSSEASSFLKFCEGDAVLIAHNGDSFDKPFLEAELMRIGMESPPCTYIDSLKWARKYRYDLPRHALQILREAFDIPSNQAHRALDDVMVLYEVFKKMTDDLTIDQIVELMDSDNLTKMPFGKYQGRNLKDVPASYILWLNKNQAFERPENQELKNQFQSLGLL